jgi:hypothetical protein
MIRVDRTDVHSPKILRSDKARRARDAAAEHFRASDARARQSLHRFAPIYADLVITAALFALFKGKCAFCESSVPASGADVHHFRPRQEAVDPRTGVVSPSALLVARLRVGEPLPRVRAMQSCGGCPLPGRRPPSARRPDRQSLAGRALRPARSLPRRSRCVTRFPA